MDKSTFQLLKIVEKGEVFGPFIPTYKETQVSLLACSLTINIHKSWDQLDQNSEKQKIKELTQYLQSVNFPVLVEVWYSDPQESFEKTKVIFITDEGNITEAT